MPTAIPIANPQQLQPATQAVTGNSWYDPSKWAYDPNKPLDSAALLSMLTPISAPQCMQT